jgi:Phage integrase family.
LTREKRVLDTKAVGRKWKEMRDSLKMPAAYQFYSLKDTGITEMLEAGVPAKFVKELADHHSLEMTEKYTHRSDAKKILEWNKLEF